MSNDARRHPGSSCRWRMVASRICKVQGLGREFTATIPRAIRFVLIVLARITFFGARPYRERKIRGPEITDEFIFSGARVRTAGGVRVTRCPPFFLDVPRCCGLKIPRPSSSSCCQREIKTRSEERVRNLASRNVIRKERQRETKTQVIVWHGITIDTITTR